MTISEMGQLPIHSKEWFAAAFEGINASPAAIRASEKICRAYMIKGQADPGYIANVIEAEIVNQINHL